MIKLEYLSENGKILKVQFNKTNIELHSDDGGLFLFSKETLSEFTDSLKDGAKDIWQDFTPKECNSLGSDYYEWYDKQAGNEATLSIKPKQKTLTIKPPYLHKTDCLYRFNKRKLESFLYDLTLN